MPAAILCALLFLWAAGCSASTPRQVVGDFVKARIAGEDSRAAKLTVEGDLEGYMGGESFLHAEDVTFDVGEPDVDGDRALVVVGYRWEDQAVDTPYIARKVGNRWKVALRETEGLWLPDIEVRGEPPAP